MDGRQWGGWPEKAVVVCSGKGSNPGGWLESVGNQEGGRNGQPGGRRRWATLYRVFACMDVVGVNLSLKWLVGCNSSGFDGNLILDG